MNSKLRVGLLVNSNIAPAWVYGMVEKILAIEELSIVLVIYNGDHLQPKKRSVKFSALFYHWYRKLDRKLFKEMLDAFEQKDINQLLRTNNSITVTPNLNNGKEIFNASDIELVKNYEPDVLIKAGFGNLEGEILTAAKYGVWDLYNANCNSDIDGTAGVYECLHNIQITNTVLRVLPVNEFPGRVLYNSKMMTNRKSVNRNVNQYYWKALNFAPRLLNLLAKNGETWFWNYIDSKKYEAIKKSEQKLPGNFLMLVLKIKIVTRILGEKINSLFFIEQWQLWLSFGNSKQLPGIDSFKRIIPPKTVFWADPHLIIKDKRSFVFFEELPYKKNIGHISAMEIDENGKHTESVKILEKPYHLSYPFIMEHAGVFYMIPETSQDRTIQLYHSSNFPYEWEFVMNLMENIHAVDSTLLFYNNTWWLFANVKSNPGMSSLDELFIYYANDFLTSEWSSHVLNPVISDVTKARPAGAFFEENGKIMRPSQSSTKIYGTGVNINEIVELNEEHYKEITIDTLEAGQLKNVLGIHSFSKKEDTIMIDAFLKRSR